MFPAVSASTLPWVSADEMREVDRVMVHHLGIDLTQMMENAGRHLADLAVARFNPTRVAVLAGTGGNGGGAMVAARHLANRGVVVTITTTNAGRMTPVPARQLSILQAMAVPTVDDPGHADLVIDGLIGYSLLDEPRGRAADLIEWTAGHAALALDVPSGLDATHGTSPGSGVEAVATLTLAAPKTGLAGAECAGELYLADISVPPTVFDALGFESLSGLNRAGIARITD